LYGPSRRACQDGAVTARCFPEEPTFEHPSEETMWTALRDQLPDGSALFANRHFTDLAGDHEADLIAGIPGAGIAIVEVKGGHITQDGETWLQTGGGVENKRIKPQEQGRRVKYVLRNYLDEDPRWRKRRVRLAHLVAFPTATVARDLNLTDCPRWMVIDKDQIAASARRVMQALTSQQNEKLPARQQDIDDLVEILTARPLSQRDLVGVAEARQTACDQLTERQAKILDIIRMMNRVEVQGGAGSGKTWLAVEQARRLARKGRRVGLLCYSRGLTAFLKRRAELFPDDERLAYVGTFHELGVAWGASRGLDNDSDYWERRLPEQMSQVAVHLTDAQKYDDFVVDEGQDFSDLWWPALVAGLRDPAHGGLYAFSDDSQRVFARHGRPPVELVKVPLDENLRNTKQIAQTFGSLTPWQMRYLGGDGPPVRFIPCTSEEAVNAADDVVVQLLDDGWAGKDIALLTTGHRHPMQVEGQARGQDDYWKTYWEGDDAFFGHVLGFKGLERPAVVLAVNGFNRSAERAREMLYVGLSRARDLLVVCGDLDLIRAVGGEGVAKRLASTQSSR
jgi:UvrD-like helicase C-terminal domain/Nuclease-related domain